MRYETQAQARPSEAPSPVERRQGPDRQTRRAGSPLGVLCLATVAFVVWYAFIAAITGPQDRLCQFFFGRGFVQPATMYVFCLAASMLLFRAAAYLRGRRQLARDRGTNAASEEELFGGRLKTLRDSLKTSGAAVTLALFEQMTEEQKRTIRNRYDSIGFLSGLLPALGLFGTVLGLSSSLYVAFSGGGAGPEAVRQFVAALATALDTTVLAVACAIPVFAASWILCRLETDLGDQEAKSIGDRLALATLSAALSVHGESRTKPAPIADSMEVFRAELRALMTEFVAQSKRSFDEILRSAVATYPQQIEQSVAAIFERQHVHEEKMVERVVKRLGSSVDRVYGLIEKQNGRTGKQVAHEIKRLNAALRNGAPHEVVLRFQRNGEPDHAFDCKEESYAAV